VISKNGAAHRFSRVSKVCTSLCLRCLVLYESNIENKVRRKQVFVGVVLPFCNVLSANRRHIACLPVRST
jgi:hypothetical protein